jgi:hypothetical protein
LVAVRLRLSVSASTTSETPPLALSIARWILSFGID